MKKLAIIIVLILPLCSSCHKLKNERMMDMVQGKGHDSRLIGWWENINGTGYYIHFGGGPDWRETYYYLNKEGFAESYGGRRYWYTEDGILYSFRVATPVTGIIDSKRGYVISEDGSIFEKLSDGSRHKKCEALPIKNPNE